MPDLLMIAAGLIEGHDSATAVEIAEIEAEIAAIEQELADENSARLGRVVTRAEIRAWVEAQG